MAMIRRCSAAIAVLFASVAIKLSLPAAGQTISTACTSSLISTFTPCFNFITGSTDGGGSPTGDCCSSLASLISTGAQCACLILTGNIPLTLPINRTLAVSLPRICGSRSVPLQCSTAVGAPLPGPGPVSYAPSLPPLPPQPPLPAISADSPPPSISTTPANQGVNQAQRPLILPNSALKIDTAHLFSMIVMFMMATANFV